jgi:hypothetical protein
MQKNNKFLLAAFIIITITTLVLVGVMGNMRKQKNIDPPPLQLGNLVLGESINSMEIVKEGVRINALSQDVLQFASPDIPVSDFFYVWYEETSANVPSPSYYGLIGGGLTYDFGFLEDKMLSVGLDIKVIDSGDAEYLTRVRQYYRFIDSDVCVKVAERIAPTLFVKWGGAMGYPGWAMRKSNVHNLDVAFDDYEFEHPDGMAAWTGRCGSRKPYFTVRVHLGSEALESINMSSGIVDATEEKILSNVMTIPTETK